MKAQKIIRTISLVVSIGGLVTRLVRWIKRRRLRRNIERMLKKDTERRALAMETSKLTHDGPKRMTAAAERRKP